MLQIAKILKSNGTDGGILIGLQGFDIVDINFKEPVFIYFDGLLVPFFIQDIRPKGNTKAIVHLNDVYSLEDAEEICGRALYIDSDLEEEQDEDFLGWTIYDKDRKIGVVDSFEDIPGNPCLGVGDILIPLHDDFVLSLDETAQTLVLDLPEGLC